MAAQISKDKKSTYFAEGVTLQIFEAGSSVDVGKGSHKPVQNMAWLISFDAELVEKHGKSVNGILDGIGQAGNPAFEFFYKTEAWRVGTINWVADGKWSVLINLVETGDRESTIARKAKEAQGSILAQKGLTKKALVELARRNRDMRVAYG